MSNKQTAPIGAAPSAPTGSAQAAASAASSEDRAPLGRGIANASHTDIYTGVGEGGYPGSSSKPYNPEIWPVPGDPSKQVIRNMVGFSVAERMEVYYGIVKPVNELAIPILALCKENQRKFQVTFGPHDGVETYQNGERCIPEETPLGLYQGDLHLEAVNRQECPKDPHADTSRDMDFPLMINDKYTCFIRGTYIDSGDCANALFFSHVCDTSNADFLRASVKNYTGETVIECDYSSDESDPKDTPSMQNSPAKTPTKVLKDEVQKNEDDLGPAAIDGKLRDARQILERHGVKIPPLGECTLQALIMMITIKEINPHHPLVTIYNSESKPGGKDSLFWREDLWDGITPLGYNVTECQCAHRINRLLKAENAQVYQKYPLDPSKWSKDDPDNWVTATHVYEHETAADRMQRLAGCDFQKDGGQKIDDTLEPSGTGKPTTEKSCHYGRWRLDKIPSESTLASDRRIKREIVNFLLNQKTEQQAKLATEGLGQIIDALRTDDTPKEPQVIVEILGFGISDTLKRTMLKEINARAGPAVELARRNHEKYGTLLCIDPNKLGGSRLFNGGRMMGGSILLGFDISVVIPTSKVPLNLMTEAYPLDVYFFNEATSLVTLRRRNDPLDKFNAANFGHSCLGDLARKDFNEHGSDKHAHVSCIGKWLFKRLQSPLDCLSKYPEEHRYHAADFLSFVYTSGYVGPLKELDLNRAGGKSTVSRVVDFAVMPLEYQQLPRESIALPCDCTKPYRCAKNAFVVCNTHINPEYLTRTDQYNPSTTRYDNKPSKAFIDNFNTAREKIFFSSRSYQETLTLKCENPPLEVVLSMARGDLAFKGNEFGQDVEETSDLESSENEDICHSVPRNKRGGRRPLSDDENDDGMDSPDAKRAKPDAVVEAIEPVAGPVAKSKAIRRILPTVMKLQAVVEAAEPVAEPKPAAEVRGQCGKCGMDVTTAHAGRVKTPAFNVYFHKECYDTQGDGAGGI